MDRIRYAVGVFSIILLPSGLLFWFLIHPWARAWRRLGPARTYAIVLCVVALAASILSQRRAQLLGRDLGMNRTLLGIALALYLLSLPLELRYWRQLRFSTLVGIPELSREVRPDTLLLDGAYRLVRHPRYLSAALGVIGNALVVNYAGLYVVLLILFPAGMLMLALEERELVGRFGERYQQYQREVPQLIPRLRRRG